MLLQLLLFFNIIWFVGVTPTFSLEPFDCLTMVIGGKIRRAHKTLVDIVNPFLTFVWRSFIAHMAHYFGDIFRKKSENVTRRHARLLIEDFIY